MDKEYPSNSYAAKQQPTEKVTVQDKKLNKVISSSARTKKKSKIKDALVSEDASSVKSYIIMEVLIPAFKKAVSDVVTNGIDMILYGETGKSKRRSGSKVSYTSYYDRERERERRRDYPRISGGFDYEDIILDSRGEGEAVLMQMDTVIDQYGSISIADLYDLVGIPNDNYQNNNYGWTDLRMATVKRTYDGYILKLPRAVSLK